MPVTRPCYVPRETVMRAAGIHFTARNTDAVDRAIEASSQRIDDETHRRFYCAIETNVRDWPNFDRSYPWRVYLNDHELADVTTTVPVVTSGTITIPAGRQVRPLPAGDQYLGFIFAPAAGHDVEQALTTARDQLRVIID